MNASDIERLSVVETKVDRAVADIAEVKTNVNVGFTELNTKIDNLDNKYAAKWVQNALAFVIGLIVAAVITALIALVVGPIRGTSPTGVTPVTQPTTQTQ